MFLPVLSPCPIGHKFFLKESVLTMPSTDAKESLSQSPGWLAALEEARQGFSEGGLPIGACVVSESGKILGRGHNMLVQNGTPQMHVRFVLRCPVSLCFCFLILARRLYPCFT
jgi:hypothetical protein